MMNPQNRQNVDEQNSHLNIIYEQERIIKELNVKIADLETNISLLKEVNKNMQADITAVKRDRDECVKLLQANSMNPLFYASTQKRDDFWKVIHENIAFLKDKAKFEQDTINKLDEKDDEILKQRIMIEHLRKEIANHQVTNETNQKLRSEIENLYDHLLKEQAKNKDLTIKIMSLEKQAEQSEKNEKETAKQLELMNTAVKKKIETFTEEQKTIAQSIKAIKDKGIYLKNQELANYGKFETKYFSADTNLDQFIIRLRTTSIHADKFGEVIELLTDMLRSTKENQNEIETKGPKNYLDQRRALANKGLSQKLEEPQNYKLFLRGLQSSNIRVIVSTEHLILEIGNYTQRIPDFIESGSIPILVKSLRSNNDPLLRTNSIGLLRDLAISSPKITQELYNNGFSFFLSAQIKQNFKEVAANSDYLLKVLTISNAMLMEGCGKREFIQNDLISILFYLLGSTDLTEIKKNVLAMIPYLTEDPEKRVSIYENGDFNSLWGIFIEGDKISDKSLLYLAIEALVQFLKDDKIIMLFMTSDRIFQSFDIFTKCLTFPGSVPPSTKSSIIDIISQLLRAGSKNPEFEKQIFKNDLLKILVTQLQDGDVACQKQCLNTLIYLKELIFKNAEKFAVSLRSLTGLLSSQDKEVIVLTLKFMDVLAEQPKLLDDMAHMGLTNVLASFFVHDPKEIDPSILVEAGYLLLKLEDSPVAVAQMVEAQTFLTILPLLTQKNPEIKKFWYHAIVEFCNHREFRAQLENQPIYLSFIKKALEDVDLLYSEQLCFALRVLFQSRFLVNYLADESTVQHIYNFFNEFAKEANVEFMVYILEITALLAQTSEGYHQLLENGLMLEILGNQIQKEEPKLANTAGRLIIFLLEDEGDTSLVKSSIYDGLSIYAQSADPEARDHAAEIIDFLKQDPEYAEKVEFIERQAILDQQGY